MNLASRHSQNWNGGLDYTWNQCAGGVLNLATLNPAATIVLGNLRATGTAILYTTHYLEEAENLCQRIGIIDHGKLLAEGKLGELQERIGGGVRRQPSWEPHRT